MWDAVIIKGWNQIYFTSIWHFFKMKGYHPYAHEVKILEKEWDVKQIQLTLAFKHKRSVHVQEIVME